MIKNIPLQEIIDYFINDIIAIQGDPSKIVIKHLKATDDVDEYSLDWVNTTKEKKQVIVEQSKAHAILVGKGVTYTESIKKQDKVLIVVDNPKLTIAKIGNVFFVNNTMPAIDSTAIIQPQATIYENVYIGPYVTVGKAIIGYKTIIHANVTIHDGVQIGKNVTIKSGAQLGGEGFGFERISSGELIKFPQLGGLIIQDWVEIGSNTCIDKGALSDTIIGQGTKINNLCHIAHNVIIGKNVIITAHVNVSGSTIIEDNVWIAPNASLRGHQKIGRGATIGMGAVVTRDVPAGETWVGNPARKMVK